MNSLDIIVLAVVVLSGLFAFMRGFVREALSIAAWLGAAAVAYYFYPALAPAIGRLVVNQLVAQLVTVGILFVGSLIVFSLFVGMVSARVRASSLGSADRTLGLLFGLARGALVICLAYLVAMHVIEPGVWPPKPDQLPPWIAEAKLLPYLQRGADPLHRMVPEEFIDKSAEAAANAGEQLENADHDSNAPSPFDVLRPDPKPDKHTPDTDPAERQNMNRTIEKASQ